jgi:hypothetical protein
MRLFGPQWRADRQPECLLQLVESSPWIFAGRTLQTQRQCLKAFAARLGLSF